MARIKSLARLRYALALAQMKSFSKAAERCHVTQPTLSSGISQLEAELGTRLFVRAPGAIKLSDAGTRLLPAIGEIIGAEMALVELAESAAKDECDKLRIGMSPLVVVEVVERILEGFHADVPHVIPVLEEANVQDLEAALRHGELDVAIGPELLNWPEKQKQSLWSERLLFLPCDGDGSQEAGVRFSDIAGKTFILVPDQCGLTRVTRSLFRAAGYELHAYPGHANSYHVLEHWSGLGIGASILPESKVTAENRGACPLWDDSGQEITIGYGAAWRMPEEHESALSLFLTHLVSQKVQGGGLAASVV